jgi:hypothetical protein
VYGDVGLDIVKGKKIVLWTGVEREEKNGQNKKAR